MYSFEEWDLQAKDIKCVSCVVVSEVKRHITSQVAIEYPIEDQFGFPLRGQTIKPCVGGIVCGSPPFCQFRHTRLDTIGADVEALQLHFTQNDFDFVRPREQDGVPHIPSDLGANRWVDAPPEILKFIEKSAAKTSKCNFVTHEVTGHNREKEGKKYLGYFPLVECPLNYAMNAVEIVNHGVSIFNYHHERVNAGRVA